MIAATGADGVPPALAEIFDWLQLDSDALARINAFTEHCGMTAYAQLLDILSAAACGLGSWPSAGEWLTRFIPDARHAPLDLLSHDPAALRAFRLAILEELYRMETIRKVLKRC